MDIVAGIFQKGQTTAKTYAGVYVGGSDPTGRYAINNEPEGEVVALSGPDDEGPYYKSGYWRGTDGHGVVIGQRFGVLTGRRRVDWCNDEDDLPEWLQYALNDYRSKKK